jgi:cell division protein FtsW (lipid II flippase)
MLYVATKKVSYLGIGLFFGSGAALLAYRLFSHVRIRVLAWKDPFSVIDGAGYQISQSLFAIGTGGWFGLGLYEGMPDTIPVACEDFVFSAISEEMGGIFAICLIFLAIGIFLMIVNIAFRIKNQFYKLIALGLGTVYGVQVFINIGGVIKFIPSTGVTLPFVSYGGSSLFSSFIMIAIIQGLYMMDHKKGEKNE